MRRETDRFEVKNARVKVNWGESSRSYHDSSTTVPYENQFNSPISFLSSCHFSFVLFLPFFFGGGGYRKFSKTGLIAMEASKHVNCEIGSGLSGYRGL